MSLFSGSKKSTAETILILDVGSSSIGAGIALLDKNGPPALLSHARKEAVLDDAPDPNRLAQKMLGVAEETLAEVLGGPSGRSPQKAPAAAEKATYAPGPQAKALSHAAVFLPAPWSSLSLFEVRMAPDKPVLVTIRTLQHMIAESLKGSANPKGIETIEQSALGLKLNGYAMDVLPKNTTASSVDITAIKATADGALLQALRSAVQSAVGRAVAVSFHSTNVSLAYGLRTMAPEEGDYLLCNNEGEFAELLLVKEHTPQGSSLATQGCSTLLRTLSAHAGMTAAESGTALTLARDENSAMREKLLGTLASAQKVCAEGFQGAAQELVQHFGAPAKIYVVGNGPAAEWYTDAVANAAYLKALSPGGILTERLSPKTAAKFLAPNNQETPPRITNQPLGASSHPSGDIFLLLETLFCDSRFDRNLTFNFSLK